MPTAPIPDRYRADIEALWDFNQMHHEPRPVDLGIGLGSHDLGVVTCAAELYHRGMFPTLMFTGANAPTTIDRFPRGEAVHYREHALTLGVPDSSILVEPNATHTGENIDFARNMAAEQGITVRSIMVISRPYQQRRAYATCRRRWPEVDVVCASQELSLDDYTASIGDTERVINMLVGDTQRLWTLPEHGWAIEQNIPEDIQAAYDRLVAAGFSNRVIA